MAELPQIREPGTEKPPAPQRAAFLELGFRPLYVAGCFWAAASVFLWVFAPGLLRGQLAGVIWHSHEMLWGFIGTIAVGFLLTAVANWTGINPLKGRALGTLSMLWILARVGYLMPGRAAFTVATTSELLFFTGAAIAMGLAIYGARSRRNYGVPLLVLALGVTDALFLLAARQGDYLLLMQHLNMGLLCMTVIALLVARRVIPFFAMRAVPGLSVPMHTRSGHWQLAAGGLAISSGLLGWTGAMALFLTVAGTIALVQVLAWKPSAVRGVPLLWILYVGYASLGAGLLVAAAQAGAVRCRAPLAGACNWRGWTVGADHGNGDAHGAGASGTAAALKSPYRVLLLPGDRAAALRLAGAAAHWPGAGAPARLGRRLGLGVRAVSVVVFPMLIRPRIDAAAVPVLKPDKIAVRPREPH